MFPTDSVDIRPRQVTDVAQSKTRPWGMKRKPTFILANLKRLHGQDAVQESDKGRTDIYIYQ